MLRSGGYNYDRREASSRVALRSALPSRAIQSAKVDCDINEILRRFKVTGVLPQGVRVPQYGDFTEAVDFQSAMNVIRKAEESFMELPAAVRKRFQNSPQEFMDFCTARDADGKLVNLDEMRKLGLAVDEVKVVESPPMKVEVVNSAPPESPPKG